MKITKEHLIGALVEGHERSHSPHPITYEQNTAVVLQELIDQREAEHEAEREQYQDLVTKVANVVAPGAETTDPGVAMKKLAELGEAYRRLCPPPDPHKLLADEVRVIADEYYKMDTAEEYKKLRKIATKIEKLGELI